jgi:hypothetical protein
MSWRLFKVSLIFGSKFEAFLNGAPCSAPLFVDLSLNPEFQTSLSKALAKTSTTLAYLASTSVKKKSMFNNNFFVIHCAEKTRVFVPGKIFQVVIFLAKPDHTL